MLQDIKRVCPAYDEKEGYELAGIVWSQGWSDMCDGHTYPDRDKPGGYDLYSKLQAHFIKEGRMVKREEGRPGWEVLGSPAQEGRVWRFTSFDPLRDQDMLPVGEAKRFRDLVLPAGMDQWYLPEFDDSTWQVGKAPIGKGAWKRGGRTVQNSADWGRGEFLLMRTAFEVDRLDYAACRISVLARQGFHIYLNGHKIHTYIWWKDEPCYRSIILSRDETKHLKEWEDVLAAYANVHCDRRSPDPYASIDDAIESITKEGQDALQEEMDRILPPKEREILEGASNGGYHDPGSAKIMSQIGRAFAEAMAGR